MTSAESPNRSSPAAPGDAERNGAAPSHGERFADVGRGITLCHQSFGSEADPPILLVMGLGTQMVGWHEDFCGELAARGFHVIRFDNRDIGRSTHVEDLPSPRTRQLVTRRFHPDQYSLGDMAADAEGLLDVLGLDSAHLVGASMGGMIAQTMAANHPERVRSLVSIMSSTGHRFRGQPSLRAYRHLLRRPPTSRVEYVERAVELFDWMGSPGFKRDPEVIRELAAQSYDRGHDPRGVGRQLAAVLKSGDRTKMLQWIRVPTTVIHGDADQLVTPSGGRATAKAIPGARLRIIEGMGHDLPREIWPELIDAIVSQARRVDDSADADDGAGVVATSA